MTRRTRKAGINLSLFGAALCFIIYLNLRQSGRSNPKSFAWKTITYRSATTTLPNARGHCPGLATSTKPALVVSRVAADGDSQWLDPLREKYHMCIYTVDQPADEQTIHLQVPANRGHEAMAYLTFLIDNYADIPPAGAVFVHGSRWAWHNDEVNYDNAALLGSLNVSSALYGLGYHNMRCDWSASTCASNYGPPQGSLETLMNAKMQPWDARSVSDAALATALSSLFGLDAQMARAENTQVSLGRTDALRAQCCAQFVVSRERVWQHSRSEYVALRQWLLDGSSDTRSRTAPHKQSVAPADDRIAGRIMSYLWHIIFLPDGPSNDVDLLLSNASAIDLGRLNDLACPRADECYCRLYGRCDLKGCTADRCHGQYNLPPGLTLPPDWASQHS